MAWKAATISGLDGGDAPLITNYDVIIVDDKPETMAKAIESSLPLLSSDGVLVTTEPMVPTGDVDEGDDERMALVTALTIDEPNQSMSSGLLHRICSSIRGNTCNFSQKVIIKSLQSDFLLGAFHIRSYHHVHPDWVVVLLYSLVLP